nr:MliC family protein [Pseudomonas entomophila]
MESLICQSQALSSQDRDLARTYKAALAKAGGQANRLKAEQRGWIKGRDECWKADDQNACLRSTYTQRTVELQVGYALVAHDGPIRFDCGDKGQIDVSFYKTDPPAVAATYRDQRSIMIAVPSESGMNFQGQNESFRGHQEEATVTWGADGKAFTCRKQG